MDRSILEQHTGQLFGQLWAPFDANLFDQSVALFDRRLVAAGFDKSDLVGRRVLDAGCGGGRNSIAMAKLGAHEVFGIDIGAAGIADARQRAAGLDNVSFEVASILDIPFADASFDLVWCAGVMMITADENRALDELTRVLKPGGMLYLLVYADEGMRWPLINSVRPLAQHLGIDTIEAAMDIAGSPANKRRTFLDDLFCPKLDFYNWDRLERMLTQRGYTDIDRWGDHVRYDHEHSLADYKADLQSLCEIFDAGRSLPDLTLSQRTSFEQSAALATAAINAVAGFEDAVAGGELSEKDAIARIIGQGHHRVMARKPEATA